MLRVQTINTEKVPVICLLISLILFFLSLTVNRSTVNPDKFAATVEKRIAERMRILDRFASEALNSNQEEWLELKNLPKDMVIYRYEYDTLQSWCNQFPIINDNISSRMVFHTITSLKTDLISPLTKISDSPEYMNLGTKWYIVKSVSDEIKCRVICGLEIKNVSGTGSRSGNVINPMLRVPDKYDITPLSSSGGTPVYLNGKPVMKIVSETTREIPIPASVSLRWLALLFFVFSAIAFILNRKSLKALAGVTLVLAVCAGVAYVWGYQMRSVSVFFSPTVYADGPFLFSFGSLMILNGFVCSVIFCLFMIRDRLVYVILRDGRRRWKIIYGAVIAALIFGTCAYIDYTIASLIINSNISLDLYMWHSLSGYSLMTYISYFALFYALLMLVQMLRPVFFELFRIRYSVFSKKFLFAFSALCALYLTVTAGNLGFRKELNRINIWTNRLAVERDLALEIQLKSVEDAIASDHLIAALAGFDRSNILILNHLNENYFYGITQDYNITVTLSKENDNTTYTVMGEEVPTLEYFSTIISSASPLSNYSRFAYLRLPNGASSYIGAFSYYSERSGLVHMFIEIESKSYRTDTGYSSILDGLDKPDDVSMPQFYSYAKYLSGHLVNFRGNYPYPTVISPDIEKEIDRGARYFRAGKFIHFVNKVSSDEVIIISRSARGAMTYIISFSYLVIFFFLLFFITSGKARREKTGFLRNYYRSSINTLVFISLFLTLIVMAIVSVAFVYRRNETNMVNMMSSKINTIQALMEVRCRSAKSYQDLNSPEFLSAMESIGRTTESDITLYTPSGKAFRSTAPEVFDKMLIGFRIDQDAYYNIKYRNQRFYIGKEEIAGRKFYALYAPLFNAAGDLVAIMNSPYTDQSYAFKRDAFFHGATIINLFIILLFITILVSTAVVNALFKPLLEIGKRMESTDIQNLDYITYKRKDEISTLVDAYNKMARDLSESTKKLAQSERDQAWSEMARQVAHEIKNPLTPIKLEIQRLIRLKEKNDPAWNEKFDKVAAVVLEHIDILTDTANEFSTFAKLYSEEPVALNLDDILRDQILIFDNKDNIRISYIGLSDAYVMAPKPQLIRVFVNLITNAIQAIEIMQKDEEETGKEVTLGKLVISLRNSIRDGFYDIVFDDNGPGVSEENLGKLFTPNFTTKNSGTGLGLAICRNIVEKCDGEIFYQKSFAFGGACFTVRLPKLPKPVQ